MSSRSSSDYVVGIDVSHYQRPFEIPWHQAANEGVRFCFARIAYGLRTDDTFRGHIAQCRMHGIVPGLYAFALMDECPVTSAAKHAYEGMAGGWHPSTDLPLFLDVETPPAGIRRKKHERLTPLAREEWIGAYIDHHRLITGVRAGIYSGPRYWNRYVRSKAFAHVAYWAARYPTTSPDPDPFKWFHRRPNETAGWGKNLDIWQYTSQGKIKGYHGRIDKNIMLAEDFYSRLRTRSCLAQL